MHHVDSTEPSVLAHEILTARPYAFLDDDELPDRRTRAVPLRRGLPVDLNEIGALKPEAIAEVRAELAPNPRTPDELHDLLRDVVLLRARADWSELFEQLEARGRGRVVGPTPAEPILRWYAAESQTEVEVLLGTEPATEPEPGSGPGGDSAPEMSPERVAADLLRGHLELLSPVAVDQLQAETGLSGTLLAVGLATLESEGSAIQGRFTNPNDTSAPIEWCSRRLLARMHGRSRKQRRRAAESVSPEQFVRFLVRWQSVGPGCQQAGPAGLGRVLDQLQGWEAAVASWEPGLLASRVRNYDPSWIDRLCHDGEIQWLRASPRPPADPDRRGGGPSKATPITIAYRQDLPWLLPASRGDEPPPLPTAGAVAEIADVLDRLGPRFATDLTADTGRLATDVEAALWDGVARGLFTADGFESIRALTRRTRASARRRHHRSLSRMRRNDSGSVRSAGRWSLVPGVVARPAAAQDRHELAEAVADQLLARWGVLFYDLVRVEKLAMPWRELQWALRRMEDRGLIAGGRFVGGFSGEQFALPEAVEGLAQVRKSGPSTATVTVCGTDPLNLTGTILAGDRVPARRSQAVALPV
jgi:ATP-dependent Lhr-like helicase